MTYEIKLEQITHPTEGVLEKYFIYYYGGILDGYKEFYGLTYPNYDYEVKGNYTELKKTSFLTKIFG